MSIDALPEEPLLSVDERARLTSDYERHADQPIGSGARDWALERWRIDIAGRYAGRLTTTPFGKASGQLSMTRQQIEADAAAGVGFVVLKTVIAEDVGGGRGMEAWAVHETRMRVEPIVDETGASGWTVSWKGRGWDRSFADYETLYAEALAIGAEAAMPIAASVKYHLPSTDDEEFRTAEYGHTTDTLARVWAAANDGAPMLLEKDFSPTLAGDPRSDRRESILRWLREVPALIAAAGPPELALGMKVMNARFDDAFQCDMLAAVHRSPQVRFVTAFNRLFDRRRGLAYGGPALSRRNLRVLADYVRRTGSPPRAFSATGDIQSGRRMIEYALLGAESGQLHTYFQLPRSEYRSAAASRAAAAMHELLLNPARGLLAWMLTLERMGRIPRRDGMLRFLDVASGATSEIAA